MTRRRWSTTVRMAIRERFGAECQMCRMPLGVRGFDLDHAIPLAMGGEDVEDNLRPLCLPCHRLKTRGDVGAIAKARRREASHVGAKAPSARPIRSRGFDPQPRRLKRTAAELARMEQSQ